MALRSPHEGEAVVWPSGRVRFEPSPRWVRVFFGGVAVADSKRVRLLLEGRKIGVYYFPTQDVRTDLLIDSDRATTSRRLGTAKHWHVRVGGRVAEDAAWRYVESPVSGLTEHVAFDWGGMDAWFEEDDEVFVHPRSPYHRVDVLQSSRHVRVDLNGATVAETSRPRLLFETDLPTRYYIPKIDVRMDLLTPSDRRTRCPYKGEAVYWSAKVDGQVFRDIVWSYPAPIPECPKIENQLAFFNERADIWVDGELQERPRTPWSRWG